MEWRRAAPRDRAADAGGAAPAGDAGRHRRLARRRAAAAARLADGLDDEVDRLRIAAEQAGLLPVGIHFDSTVARRPARELGETLEPPARPLSRGVSSSRPTSTAARSATSGSRRSRAASTSWSASSTASAPASARIRAPGTCSRSRATSSGSSGWRAPTCSARSTLGGMTLRGRDGAVKAEHHRGRPARAGRRSAARAQARLLARRRRSPDLRVRGALAAAVGGWSLAAGDSVRVVKTATPFLEEFLRRTGAWESPNRLGEIFYRQPGRRGAALGRRGGAGSGARAERGPAGARARARAPLPLGAPLAGPRAPAQRRIRADRPRLLRHQLRRAAHRRRAASATSSPGDFRRFELLFEGHREAARCGRCGRRTPSGSSRRWSTAARVYESGDVELRLGGPDPDADDLGDLPPARRAPARDRAARVDVRGGALSGRGAALARHAVAPCARPARRARPRPRRPRFTAGRGLCRARGRVVDLRSGPRAAACRRLPRRRRRGRAAGDRPALRRRAALSPLPVRPRRR